MDTSKDIEKAFKKLRNDPPKHFVESLNPDEAIPEKKIAFVMSIIYAMVDSMTDSQKASFMSLLKQRGVVDKSS